MAVSAYGFADSSEPLSAIVPVAGPGCSLLVKVAFLQLEQPVAGAADTRIRIPATPSLVGSRFYHQVMPLEIDALGIVAVTGTNGLALLVGTY
jgi:hypothetical protein